MLASLRSRCVVFGFASTAVYTVHTGSPGESGEPGESSTANTTGTRCGRPSGVIVASRAIGDCAKLAFGSNPPTVSA